MFKNVAVLLVAIAALIFQPAFAAEPPTPAPMVELDKSNKARSKYTSLHKRLDKLREQFEAGDGKRMIGTLKSANRDLEAARKKDADLDLSAERAELDAFASLAETMVAEAEAAKRRDRAFKSLDKEIKKLEKMIAQAERSKPRPEKFQASLEKAEGLLEEALSSDPAADGAKRQIALEAMPGRYAAAQTVFLHSGQFKAINQRLVALGKLIDKTEKPFARVNTYIRNAVEKEGEIWPKKVTDARAKVLSTMEEALAAQPDIDLQVPNEELAALDARIAEIRPGYVQNGLDLYFGDQLDDFSQVVAGLDQSFDQGSSFNADELSGRVSSVKEIGATLESSADFYAGSDLSEHDARYAKLSGEFDAVAAKHQTRRDLIGYLKNSERTLAFLGSEHNFDLPYMYKDVLESGIEDFDIETFRQRLSESDETARSGRADENYAFLESRMKGNDYINGVKELLKQTNRESANLTERTNIAQSSVRLALLGQKFYPDDTRYDALVEETRGREAAIKAERAARYADASTGAFHMDNMDRIVFSTAPLEIGNEDTSLVSTTFEAGQPIYGTAYLSSPIGRLSNEYQWKKLVRLDMQIGGRVCGGYGRGNVRDVDLTSTVMPFAVLPVIDGYVYEDHNHAHMNFAQCLQDNATLGEQDVRVEVGLTDPNSVDGGKINATFKLTYDAESVARIKPIVAELNDIRIGASRMPKPAMSDPALEATMIEVASLNVDGEPLRAVLSRDVWSIEKNEVDIPVRQRLAGHVAMKLEDGTCVYYSTIIAREYTGGGSYAAPRPYRLEGAAVAIRCENVGE